MLTGATGFLGSHTAEALLAAGHGVRALVRSKERVARVLEPRGIEVADLTVGDMSDADSVRKALEGCDAVVHTAATFYGDDRVLEANVAGVRNALGIAHELGLDPIVYISTIATMYPPPGPVLTVDDPLVSLETTYGKSKAEGERYARELQAQGAPVVIIYPGGIWGPHDPNMGETTKGLRDAIRWGWPITTTGVSVVDVRDLANVIVASLEAGKGPRRFMAGGHFLTWPEKADLVDSLTGRRARRIPSPPILLRGVGRILDLAKKIVPFEYPLTHEAALMMSRMVPCDSSGTVEALGIEFRPSAETLGDAIRWLHEIGQLDAKRAGKLAS